MQLLNLKQQYDKKIKLVWKLRNNLGESPIWVKNLNSVFFVDINRKKFFQYNSKNQNKNIYKVDKKIGFIAHKKKFEFILGLKDEIRFLDIKKKNILKSIKIKDYDFNRINDGKIDSEGNIWFGTMDEHERGIKSGSLFCLDKENKIHKVDEGYITPNGPAFINKNQFYYTASKKKIIYKISHKKFKVTKKIIFKKFNNNLNISPDGMDLDKYGNLWVCFFRGYCVMIFDKNGKKIYQFNFPAKNITSCTFAEKNQSKIFFTTARKSMNKKELKRYHLSGSLFNLELNNG